MLSPGYSYEKAPDQEHFLGRTRIRTLFRQLFGNGVRGWRFNQSPLFLEFLTGGREYECTPWGNPTYTVFGWQRPCYLLQDGYASSFQELMDATEWTSYGRRSGNPSCQDCMVHSGFEASAVDDAFSSPRGMLAMVRALLLGPRVPAAVQENEAPRGGQTRHDGPPPTQGWAATASPESLRVAFDYRGMVTLTLDDGSEVEGYVSNLGRADIDLWAKERPTAERIPITRVRNVILSGRDPARSPLLTKEGAGAGRARNSSAQKTVEKPL